MTRERRGKVWRIKRNCRQRPGEVISRGGEHVWEGLKKKEKLYKHSLEKRKKDSSYDRHFKESPIRQRSLDGNPSLAAEKATTAGMGNPGGREQKRDEGKL